MIFYRAIDAAGKLRLATTQIDAKKINKEYDQIDVPVDKPGLHAFLSELLDQLPPIAGTAPVEPAAEAIVAAEDPKPEPKARPVTVPSEPIDVTAVLDFVLNEATTGQVENVFAALGTRFAEAIGE